MIVEIQYFGHVFTLFFSYTITHRFVMSMISMSLIFNYWYKINSTLIQFCRCNFTELK